ncbi:MAG: type IV pilus assembly protein PilM [Acidobacteria bacterium]|nr:type IV pilus assembly protein PilM [Acidobacteriota bacterium]
MSRMSALFTRRSPVLVGLDIGSSAVKAVEVEPTRASLRIVAAGAAPVPRGAVVDGVVVDGGAVAGAIRSVVDAHGVRARAVAASLAGSAVLVRRITVPRMSDSELDESIYWEVDQYVPVDLGDVTLDYQVLDRERDGDRGDTMDVLLVVAKKDRVAECASVIELAGLEPAVIDVDALALHNAYESAYGADRDPVVLVHAGASAVTTAVVRAGRLELTRDVSLARYMQSTGEPGGARDEAYVEDVGREPRAAADDKATAELVALEVERAIEDCCADEDAADSIDRIVVSGGGACAPGFAAALADRVEARVVRFEPCRGLEIASRVAAGGLLAGDAPAAAVALGLALRRRDDR